MIIKDANVTVMVNEMDRAVEFYINTLGLKLKGRYGDEFAQVEAAGMTIGLHPANKNGPKPGDSGSLSIGFGVDSLDKAMAELKSRGVKFSQILDDNQVMLAFFTDPDGDPLYLSEIKWG